MNRTKISIKFLKEFKKKDIKDREALVKEVMNKLENIVLEDHQEDSITAFMIYDKMKKVVGLNGEEAFIDHLIELHSLQEMPWITTSSFKRIIKQIRIIPT